MPASAGSVGAASSHKPALIAAVAALLVAYAVGLVAVRLGTPWDGNEAFAQQNTAASVASDGVAARPAAGHSVLQPGETVWAINGQVLSQLRRPPIDTNWDPSGTELSYELVSAGGGRTVVQPLQPFPWALLLTDWGPIVAIVGFVLVASFVFLKRPRDPAAQLLFILTALFLPTMLWRWIGVNDIYDGPVFSLLSLLQPTYFLGISMIIPFALVFPRPSGWARGHLGLILAITAIAPLAAVIVLIEAQVFGSTTFAWTDRLATIELLTYVSVGVALVVILPLRYRRLADAMDRRSLTLVVGSCAVVYAVLMTFWMLPQLVQGEPLLPWSLAGLVALPIPVAFAVAILRYGAFDMQRLVNRSLVYVGATAAIALIYVVLVGTAVLNVHEKFGFAVALLVTGLVIFIAQPIRDGLQRAVNRLMYGDRDDPYQSIVRLGHRIDSSIAPTDVMPTVVETVATSLHVPYVAVERHQGGEPVIAASVGEPVSNPASVPLVHQGELVGRLLMAPRVGEGGLSEADMHLLGAFASHVAAHVKNMELDDELRLSRERLISAREEERRQLRRELHDDIGPSLAGSLLQLQAARAALTKDPKRAAELIGDLETETRETITEIRRIARDLRPPALDDLGLLDALRAQVAHFAVDPQLQIEIQAPDDLPELPAAVEVAAYRIVLEALSNIARHADARHCWIGIAVGDQLVVTVADNGVGVTRGRTRGVGLRSMKERATELGGSFAVSRRHEGGTLVTAKLPLKTAEPLNPVPVTAAR